MTRAVVAERLHPKSSEGTGYEAMRALGVAATTMTGPADATASNATSRVWTHGALLYRWKKETRLFHMLGHHVIADSDAPALAFLWAEPRVAPEKARLIATRCRLMVEVQKEDPTAFPYGFKFAASIVGKQGKPEFGQNEIGFTCSTIVCAIFAGEGCALVDMKDWPPADGIDKRARTGQIRTVQNDDVHAELLRHPDQVDSPRVRPQDVVAAAALFPPARTFEDLVDGATVVDERLGMLTPLPRG